VVLPDQGPSTAIAVPICGHAGGGGHWWNLPNTGASFGSGLRVAVMAFGVGTALVAGAIFRRRRAWQGEWQGQT